MKRIFVCLVPFLATNIGGMGFFGGSDEKKHEKFIDSIYANGLKSLAVPDKKNIKFDQWGEVFDSALAYAKDNDKDLKEIDFDKIREASTNLKKLFKNFNEKVIDDAEKYAQNISSLYNTYVKKAAEIKSSTTTRKKRYAQEALAALVNVMQFAALDLQEDFLDVVRAQAALEKQVSETTGKAVELAKSADDFRKNAQRLKDKSLRPSAFDKYLQRFTEKRFIETSADKEFDDLVARIAKIGNQEAFNDVLPIVNEYAEKHNPDAHTANSKLNFDMVKHEHEQAARNAAEKIAKSLFTSRSKRYPYELYAKLWNKALVLKAQGKIKAKA